MRRLARGVPCFLGISLLLALAFVRHARADGERPDFAFGSAFGEAGTAAFALAANAAYLLPQADTGWKPSHVQDYHPGMGLASDMLGAFGGSMLQLGTGYLFESGYLASSESENPGVEALHAMAVESEALLLTSGITALIKRVTGRCRPRAYTELGCRESNAFPSGHTSTVASFAGARIVRLALTPDAAGIAYRGASLALAEASTISAGLLRVFSGAHSWEDVLVGGIIGHATGAIVAAVHPTTPVDVLGDDFSPNLPEPSAANYFGFGFGGDF